MLKLVIEGEEFFNNETEEFEKHDDIVLELEHSLVSLSKWESKYQKPFLSLEKKSVEEIFDYFKLMIVSPVDPDVLLRCYQTHLDQIQNYIDSAQSATTFGEMPERRGSREIITSELIYYWMVAFNIPFECESWHLNRLFALIRICNIKNSNSKQKKVGTHEAAAQRARLNAERRAQLGTRG